MKKDLKEKERELCDARAALLSLAEKVDAEEVSPDVLDSIAEHREAHVQHRQEDLEHARREASYALSRVQRQIQEVNELGGTAGTDLKRAEQEAESAVERAQELDVEDILKDDSPLDEVYELAENVRDKL